MGTTLSVGIFFPSQNKPNSAFRGVGHAFMISPKVRTLQHSGAVLKFLADS